MFLLNFIIYFIFILGVVLNFKGLLIKNILKGQKSFFYTFRKIHISEMLSEKFIEKFLKLLIQV